MPNTVIYFNPRSREGSDRGRFQVILLFSQFQSTLPRRERLLSNPDAVNPSVISIHAPAKGATTPLKPKELSCLFQSTLPRRERRLDMRYTLFFSIFQSTLPRRERQNAEKALEDAKKFQSTLPRRERLETAGETVTDIRFQSTLPRRERRGIR